MEFGVITAGGSSGGGGGGSGCITVVVFRGVGGLRLRFPSSPVMVCQALSTAPLGLIKF